MYEMFNLFYFFTSPLNFGNNSLLRLNNAFIEAMNHRDHLPRYILIVLNRDLIDMVNRFDYGITAQLERSIRWLSIQMDRAILARKEQLWNIKPGAVPMKDTKIIWFEMFDRPVVDAVVTICNKFNKGLNEVAKERKNAYVMVLNSLKADKHFERNGRLNFWGKMQFWREVDYLMKEFDCKCISLNPRSYAVNEKPQSNDTEANPKSCKGSDTHHHQHRY